MEVTRGTGIGFYESTGRGGVNTLQNQWFPTNKQIDNMQYLGMPVLGIHVWEKIDLTLQLLIRIIAI